jgi:hypothetical protein
MTAELCPHCGASWVCEHTPDAASESSGLHYVPPDGPTAQTLGVMAARLAGERLGMSVLSGAVPVTPDLDQRVAAMQELVARLDILSALRGPHAT